MTPCHQCGTPTDAPRNGPCTICKLDAQGFCATCALWELGPLPAPAGLPSTFRVHDAPLVPVKACPLQRGRRNLSVDRLARDCALLTEQRTTNANLYPGKTFTEALDDALAVYDEVYGGSGLDCAMMRALITAMISAHEVAVRHRRAQDDATEAVELRVAPWKSARLRENNKIADLRIELEAALTTADSRRAKERDRAAAKLTAQRCTADFLLCQQNVARLTQDIDGAENPHVIRFVHRHDVPRVAAKHVDCCFGARVPGGQKDLVRKAVASEVIEMVLRKKMPLGIARMMLRDEGGGAADAKKIFQISLALYHARSAHRPADGAQDGGFDPRRAPGYMDAAHRTFLFGDAPAPTPDLTVEAKTLLGTLYLSLDANVANAARFPDPDVAGALNDGHITAAQATYLQFLPRMDQTDPGARSACETEVRERVLDRLVPLLNVSRPDATVWLTGVIADLRTNSYFATSSFDGMVASFAAAPGAAAVESAAVRASGDVRWADVLPCDGVVGSFRGTRYDLMWHRVQADGRQGCWHYFDWRNDKDRALYDFFPLTVTERPIFVSLSMAEDLPEVDTRYGHHTVVWNSTLFRRAAFTIGDRGNPRRSMLLLLRDLLYPVAQKDGGAANAPADRALTLGNIHERWVRCAARQPFGQGAFDAMLLGPKTQMSTNANIEAHVFGPVSIGAHARGLILKDGDTRTRVLQAVPAPGWTEIHYAELPGGRVTRRPRLLEQNPQAAQVVTAV